MHQSRSKLLDSQSGTFINPFVVKTFFKRCTHGKATKSSFPAQILAMVLSDWAASRWMGVHPTTRHGFGANVLSLFASGCVGFACQGPRWLRSLLGLGTHSAFRLRR